MYRERLLPGTKFGIKYGVRFGISSEKILELIFEDSHISASATAKKLNISQRAVEKQLAYLKEMGVIERTGSRKTGMWKIIAD